MVVRATTALGTRKLKRIFVLDTQAPVVRILWAQLGAVTTVRCSLNESALVLVGFGDRVVETERGPACTPSGAVFGSNASA